MDSQVEQTAREILAEIIAASTVGKPGTSPTRSKWVSYPSRLYHKAVAALALPKVESETI